MLEFILKPWHLVVLFLASHLTREQQRVIEYLQVENQVLREKLGKGRILLNDGQRRRLAVKGKALGRKALRELANQELLSRGRVIIGRDHPRLESLLPIGLPCVSVICSLLRLPQRLKSDDKLRLNTDQGQSSLQSGPAAYICAPVNVGQSVGVGLWFAHGQRILIVS